MVKPVCKLTIVLILFLALGNLYGHSYFSDLQTHHHEKHHAAHEWQHVLGQSLPVTTVAAGAVVSDLVSSFFLPFHTLRFQDSFDLTRHFVRSIRKLPDRHQPPVFQVNQAFLL